MRCDYLNKNTNFAYNSRVNIKFSWHEQKSGEYGGRERKQSLALIIYYLLTLNSWVLNNGFNKFPEAFLVIHN
jgi:hypothetical protein